VQAELEKGQFVALPLSPGKTRDVRLNLVCRDMSAGNPEANALAVLLGPSSEPEVV
jgi:hypothetical protein